LALGAAIPIPPIGEYVADGAAKQAAWALSGNEGLPKWSLSEIFEIHPSKDAEEVRASYMGLIRD